MIACLFVPKRIVPELQADYIFLPVFPKKRKYKAAYIIKVGPGYPTASNIEDEPWKESKEKVKYIPLQAKEGDLAIFLRKDAFEIEFEKEKLLIVPQSSVLLLIRNDLLDMI